MQSAELTADFGNGLAIASPCPEIGFTNSSFKFYGNLRLAAVVCEGGWLEGFSLVYSDDAAPEANECQSLTAENVTVSAGRLDRSLRRSWRTPELKEYLAAVVAAIQRVRHGHVA
jgi:hypothetical protein